MQLHHIDWGQWAVVGPLFNTFVIALVCYVLTFFKCKLEELQAKIERQALVVAGDRRQDRLNAPTDSPPASRLPGCQERRGPEPGRRQADRLRAQWQQPMQASVPPTEIAALGIATGATTRETDHEPND
ncbi:MAG: hypothetical protein JO316_14125 [Abitibacteriaceae bacterium]|nr:hypothetical protein [Abditibacteriaceae bacterium]MBV9866486.1 hypothetical protein [Abditibacteriaceae bacterium]